MAINLKPVILSGKELLPIIEGGKGIGASNGHSSGAFAASNAIGTFSGVNACSYDQDGNVIPVVYHGKTRKDKHDELIAYGIQGGITQARIARDIGGSSGCIHMNILWEMGGAEQILHGVLEGAKGLINGITCGAGMPYRLAEIAAKYQVYYYPIISSMRAFRALWKRSYEKFSSLLGAVVYEDPWLAGGHNGLSNNEDPEKPQDPYPRIVELRKFMNEVGLNNVPIVMAGGVWYLRDMNSWLDNKDVGPIAFQFGTRPILTKESPVPEAWKKKLLTLKEGDIFLNRFSPTGFYSSAVRNNFIQELQERNERQIEYVTTEDDMYNASLALGPRGRPVYVRLDDKIKAEKWMNNGYTEAMKTPNSTLIFVTAAKSDEILRDQIDCMGCLSACKFSNWADHGDYNTGKRADPRSFCIQKTLQEIILNGDVENQLMFSGHNAYKFATDPFYKNGFVPTVKQLVDRIVTGD
ncbi:Nitronate monooxygenase [Rickettsiales bacterium Ac37b]|nr:Nitronate monooxygenase [Rickettsiales bacterium Ac37b]